MAWGEAVAAFGKKYLKDKLKDKLTKEAIKGFAEDRIKRTVVSAATRKSRGGDSRGTDRKTLQRGYGSPMDIEEEYKA